MPSKCGEINAELPFNTLIFVYEHGNAPWQIIDTDDAVEFIQTAKELGAATWLVGRTLYLFQPRAKLPRRLSR